MEAENLAADGAQKKSAKPLVRPGTDWLDAEAARDLVREAQKKQLQEKIRNTCRDIILFAGTGMTEAFASCTDPEFVSYFTNKGFTVTQRGEPGEHLYSTVITW